MQKEEQDSHIDSCFDNRISAYICRTFLCNLQTKRGRAVAVAQKLAKPSSYCVLRQNKISIRRGTKLNRKLNPLTENHLFTKAFTKGVTACSKLCAVYILKNIKRNPDGTLPKTKTGIAINAKLGGAVQRNRVKRIIREGLRPLYENLSDGLIVIVSARGAAFSKSAKSTSMETGIHSCFTLLGAYKGQKLTNSDEYRKKTYSKNTGKSRNNNK